MEGGHPTAVQAVQGSADALGLLPDNFDYAQFGRDFLNHYFALGFGSMTKKGLELQIFTQLSQAGVFQSGNTSRLQQTSVLLRIPVTRVRSLTYEMQLRSGIVSDAWFREKLLTAIRTTRYRQHTEKIEFGVENPMLRTEIEGRLKLEGRFPDYGISREILHLSIDDFAFLLEQVLNPEERKAVLDSVPKIAANTAAPNLFNTAVRELVTAASKSAGDELGKGVTKLLFGFLTGGTSEITAGIIKFFK